MDKLTTINGYIDAGNPHGLSLLVGFKELGYNITFYGNRFGWFDRFTHIPKNKYFNLFNNYNDLKNIDRIKHELDESKIIMLNMGSLSGDKIDMETLKVWEKILNTSLYYNKLFIYDGRDNRNRIGVEKRINNTNFKYKVIAKRETSLEEYPHIYPLDGFASHSVWSKNIKKDIFLSCTFPNNNGNPHRGFPRKNIRNKLKSQFGNRKDCIFIDNSIERKEYLELLNRSLISVSCWGVGYSCYRDWEILGSNALIAYKRMPNPHLGDYKDMESCIEYETPTELIEKLEILDKDRNKLMRMITESKKITSNNNRPLHRAKKILKIMESNDMNYSYLYNFNK